MVKRGEDRASREAPERKLQRLVPSSSLCLPTKRVWKRGRVRRDAGANKGQAGPWLV